MKCISAHSPLELTSTSLIKHKCATNAMKYNTKEYPQALNVFKERGKVVCTEREEPKSHRLTLGLFYLSL